MTQHEAILRYMQLYGAITPMDAWNELHITKLSTRIGEMIRDGYKIEKESVRHKNSYGSMTHYTRYRLGVEE